MITLINANALHIPLADNSVHCCVTSPPYYGLRSYGIGTENGEIGLEETPDEYIAKLVQVFREVKRVLRDDGTLWVNIGDSYATQPGKGNNIPQTKWKANTYPEQAAHRSKSFEGVKPKDLIGIPWLLAFALRADGWWLRSDIIWAKPNPMPESVTDRPTKAHEYLFLLSKRERYFYDGEAISEPAIYAGDDRGSRTDNRRGTECNSMSGIVGSTRNRRTVWTIATEPTPYAHFATYPRALVEPCVKAGTSRYGVCSVCGAPWERVTDKELTGEILADGSIKTTKASRRYNANGSEYSSNTSVFKTGMWNKTTTTGWQPTCHHTAPTVPAVVLDPFCGSGTTGIVARALGRRFVGLDLSFSYLADIARKRLSMDALEAWTEGIQAGNDGYHDLPLFMEGG